MALTQISTQGIKDGTISSADLADQSVTLAKLPHGTSSNDGKFLRANNGADPTFETVNTDLVSDTSPQLGGNLDTNTKNIFFGDSSSSSNNRLQFGVTDKDFQLYHDGSDSYISEAGTGNLIIGTGGSQVHIHNTSNNEPLAKFISNGAVHLYYDNTLMFETINGGARVNGVLHVTSHLDMNDNDIIKLGDSDDLQIYHSSSENFIDSPGGNIYIRVSNQAGGVENAFIARPNAETELYYNNSKKLETTSTGVTVTGDLLATGLFKNDTVGEGLHNTATGAKFFSNNSNDTHLEHGSNAQVKLSFISSSSTFRGAINGDANGMMILTGASGEEKGINCIANGATELYHNNSKKFETTSNGAKIDSGHLHIKSASATTSDLDMLIVDGGSTGFNQGNDADTEYGIQFRGCSFSSSTSIQQRVGSQILMRKEGSWNSHNGGGGECKTTIAFTNSTGLFSDGTLAQVDRLLINSDGNVQIPADNAKLQIGASQDLQIYHDGSVTSHVAEGTGNLRISVAGGSNQIQLTKGTAPTENIAKFIADGAVELYHNNSKKFETASYGAVTTGTFQATGNIEVFDNGRFIAGTGADLQILHNGTNSFIVNSTGFLDLQADAFRILTTSTETQAKFTANGPVELYYDNSRKFMTEGAGVKVFGHVIPSADNTHDLGISSLRWRNIYTNDLNLSNEGGANDVDGTWGSYTIQEGAEDLFLVNKRNGKKYKFNLTEVS